MAPLEARARRLALLAAGLCAAPASACARPWDPVVLRLYGQDVRLSAFEAELDALRRTGVDATSREFRASAFGRFVEDQALAIEASRLGFPGGRDRRAMEEFLISRVGPLSVAESEAREYFERHPEMAVVQPSVTLREILVGTMQEARDVVRILGSDPDSFELLARSRSRSPQAENGGRIGTFRHGELPPEIDRVVFSLAPGAVSPIVTTGFGFHVLRVDARSPEGERPFEDARSEVEARLLETKTRLRVRTLLAEILSRTQVNHDAIAIARDPGPSGPEPPGGIDETDPSR